MVTLHVLFACPNGIFLASPCCNKPMCMHNIKSELNVQGEHICLWTVEVIRAVLYSILSGCNLGWQPLTRPLHSKGAGQQGQALKTLLSPLSHTESTVIAVPCCILKGSWKPRCLRVHKVWCLRAHWNSCRAKFQPERLSVTAETSGKPHFKLPRFKLSYFSQVYYSWGPRKGTQKMSAWHHKYREGYSVN